MTIADVARRPAVVWATLVPEPWVRLRPPPSRPRPIALPTVAPSRPVPPVADRGRMVVMAELLAAWRMEERALAAMASTDPRRDAAEALVAASCARYQRLFAEHQAQLRGR